MKEVIAVYRCVCGTLISFEGQTARCTECHREYDSEVLRKATAETTWFGGEASVPSSTTKSDEGDVVDPLIGTRLDHFQILERIGRGGMGEVYRALDESLQRYVAIKILRKVAGAGNVGMQQLFHEARAQARVNHPHVAHIYYVGQVDETPYLAMELVGQQTLAQRMSQGAIPFHLIVRIAQQIALALHAAAKFDIVHGDIKPANVLMVDDATIKLSDFGLAFRVSDNNSLPGSTAGTPAYMPPEATCGAPMDHRGDMYSLGVALFQMTFHRLPYTPTINTLHEHLRQHRESAVEFPVHWPTDVPHAWHGVLQRLLQKNPDDRYPCFESLYNDLANVAPTSRPAASPLLRGLAFAIDSLMLLIPLALISVLIAANERFLITALGVVLSGFVCAAVGIVQALSGTTPGKRLMQIRIVDGYGLTPSKFVLAMRSVMQFAWGWMVTLTGIVGLLPVPYLDVSIVGVESLYYLAQTGLLLGGGRTIHDRVFKTKVVLNA